MINGPWGIGKTYVVTKFLDQNFGQKQRATDRDADPNRHKRKKRKYVCVSLFGLETIDEFDAALFQAIYPALGWKATKVGARVGKTLLKRFVGLDANFEISDVINKFDADLFVFDDLERCEAPLNKVLGYINEFVEHDGCKVIIIANEKEITKGAEYDNRREKIVGKTLEVQSAFDEAYAHFISLIDDPGAKELFDGNASEIASIYQQSELNNLRILQQTMWDFERLYRVLTEKHHRNAEAMTALVRLLFALSFEFKAGRIKTDDLRSRPNQMLALVSRDTKASHFMVAWQRYPDIDLSDTMISDELLVDILVRGIVEENDIRSSIDKSRYFITPHEEPPWRTVWHWFERTDDEFAAACGTLEREFSARSFTATGEILHVLGLRLFLSRIGVLEKTRADVLSEGKKYIDDLYTTKRLEGWVSGFSEISFGGYGGLGIMESGTSEYQELFTYLRDKGEQAVRDTYSEKGQALLKEMATNPQLYQRRLCVTNTADSLYYNVPILASIDPDVFVSLLLQQRPAAQRDIMMAFRMRYELVSIDRDLVAEKPWLRQVRDKLMEKAAYMPLIGKYRLLQTIEWAIEPALKAKESG
jgi:hypothetical protein